MMGSEKRSGSYRAGIGVAVVAALLTVWTTIVRDDGNGIGFFMVIMAVAVGWFAAARRHFPGPPSGLIDRHRQAMIEKAEQTVHQSPA